MPLPIQTLSTLQAAGSAIHAADAEMKQSVQDFSDGVKAAMLANPFDVGNDSIFETWKTLARLSQAVAQVEAEFKRIYEAAAQLSNGTRGAVSSKLKTAAPKKRAASVEREVVTAIDATDAVIKKAGKKRKSTVAKKKSKRPLGGNTAKVLARMQEILNASDFINVNRSAEAATIGMPKGSIGASIAKLLETGQLLTNDAGWLKLASA